MTLRRRVTLLQEALPSVSSVKWTQKKWKYIEYFSEGTLLWQKKSSKI
jgi:hypothetical protein